MLFDTDGRVVSLDDAAQSKRKRTGIGCTRVSELWQAWHLQAKAWPRRCAVPPMQIMHDLPLKSPRLPCLNLRLHLRLRLLVQLRRSCLLRPNGYHTAAAHRVSLIKQRSWSQERIGHGWMMMMEASFLSSDRLVCTVLYVSRNQKQNGPPALAPGP